MGSLEFVIWFVIIVISREVSVIAELREVNKKNLRGGQFSIFLLKKSMKIINWVGSFQVWAPQTQIMIVFSGNFEKYRP